MVCMNVVKQVPVAERERRNEPQIPIFTNPHVADDTYDETQRWVCADRQYPGGIRHGQNIRDIGGVPHPVTEPWDGFYGEIALIRAEYKTKMKCLLVVQRHVEYDRALRKLSPRRIAR